jgi:hypothetical protein
MMNGVLLLQLLIFSFTLWLGLYLLARDMQKPGLRFAGLGLITYALGLALTTLLQEIPEFTAIGAAWWRPLPLLLPSVFWLAATWHLIQDGAPSPDLSSGGIIGVALVLLTVLVAAAFTTSIARTLTMLVPLVFLVVSLVKIWQAFRSTLPRQPIGVLLAATLFFLLGTGLLMFPVEWLSSDAVLLAISIDLIVLGFVLGYLDTYEEGTRLLPDALRSLAAAGLASLVFSGQIMLVMMVTGETSLVFLVLLFTLAATAVILETFSGALQTALDKLIFMDNPAIRQERQMLRSLNTALPRTREAVDLMKMEDEQFARLTRRALSHFNHLEKLAANPLMGLPVVTWRLRQQGRPETTLERAHMLKDVLTEAILKLKPYSDKDFDTSEAWRYYNVLYFPYVLGLKPYSVPPPDDMDETTQAVLAWFQTQVPERTLYNWQTAAARLVAQHLREIEQDRLTTQ